MQFPGTETASRVSLSSPEIGSPTFRDSLLAKDTGPQILEPESWLPNPVIWPLDPGAYLPDPRHTALAQRPIGKSRILTRSRTLWTNASLRIQIFVGQPVCDQTRQELGRRQRDRVNCAIDEGTFLARSVL